MKIESIDVKDGTILVELVNVYDLDQKISLELTTDLEITKLENNSLYSGNDLVNEIELLKSHVKEFVSAYE